MAIARLLKRPDQSFFLFGPRGTGKSTWIRQVFPETLTFDLLNTSLALQLTREPHRLEALIGKRPAGAWVVIDEIQKIPSLLDEVHRLIESQGWPFALSGSSARKLKRGGADLLAGRALQKNLEGFTAAELGQEWDCAHALDWGSLPMVWNARPNAPEILDAHLHTYLREEIKEEGIVRQYPPFVRFLTIAAQMNGQIVNGSNIAREAAVPRASVDGYFSILVDTLVGHFLPAYQPRLKVRERAHPKFYWFDAGVARAAAGRLFEPLDAMVKGHALETWIFHELRVHNDVSRKHKKIAYYRTIGHQEIDFVIELQSAQSGRPPRLACIEVKLSERWKSEWERPIRALAAEPNVHVERMIGVYTGRQTLHVNGFDVHPMEEFLRRLHAGDVF